MEKIGNTIAFIPIRGGSTSIPLKNIKLMYKRPLVYWTLDAAENCPQIDRIVVSTDSEEIRTAVKAYDSDKVLIIDRSLEVSTNTASTESVMLECARNYEFRTMVLIQATSPLLQSDDLSRGIAQYEKKGIDSVLSVVRQKRFLWKAMGETVTPENYNLLQRPRRQEFDGFLVENGAFYITDRERLLKTQCRISGVISFTEMAEESYVEIDEPSDWVIVESLLKKTLGRQKFQKKQLKRIRCVLTDCDGVLTDGGMYYSEHGDELKKYNAKDGMGFGLLKQSGYITGIITGEDIELVRRRGEKLRVDEIHLGVKDKMAVLKGICRKYDLTFEQIAYIGDDLNDLEVLKNVGFSCTVNDGISDLKSIVDYVTKVPGGEGAFREIVDLLLQNAF
jgi:YrbI family 3-deoxy-D-manno-octulosonate 8-phosphate phosphatase